MRFYTGQHRYYCGVDLHAPTMYLCILDHDAYSGEADHPVRSMPTTWSGHVDHSVERGT